MPAPGNMLSMTSSLKAQVQIHFCVVLWGFTAILGKLISLPAMPLVFWRMLLVVTALALVPRVWRAVHGMGWRLAAAYMGIGVLVALHWLTFYGAIKLANASVAATCIALATVFTALLEPWLVRSQFSPRDLLLGVAVLPGVALVTGGVPASMRLGVAVGAVSALLVAVFGSLNKRFVHHAEPLAVTGLELGAGVGVIALLSVVVPSWLVDFGSTAFTWPSTRDSVLLLVLAFGCTLLPFALALVALRHMSAFAAQLAVNLEPVYANGLAIVLLGEQRELSPAFYMGVAIILGAVFAHPFVRRPRKVASPTAFGTAEAKSVVD